MAMFVENSFLLSPTDSSLDDKTNSEPCSPTQIPTTTSKKRKYPSINTSPPAPVKRTENSGDLLRSAVANALGVDASSLPQPFRAGSSSSGVSQRTFDGSESARKESSSSSSIYSQNSQPVDVTTWRKSMGGSIEKRLTVAIANILELDSTSIPVDESFVDLGGTHRQARELRANCMDAGLSIKTKDIMNCKTIAELETCVAPLTISRFPRNKTSPKSSPTAVRPLDINELNSPTIPPEGYQSRALDQALEPRRPPAIPPKAPARFSAIQSRLKHGPSRKRYTQVEQALSLHNDISKVSVLRPKAGLFEGQLVAFVTLASCTVEGPADCEVKLQNAYNTIHLPTIQKAAEPLIPPGLVPGVWVVLEKMPVDDTGKNNRRKLQTWIQNANDELHKQIGSINSGQNVKQPSTAIERRLQKIASKVLKIDQATIGMNMSFTNLGGDESTATKFVAKCESQGISLNAEDVMRVASLSQLAASATSSRSHFRNPNKPAMETFELSPMQRLYFHTPMGNDGQRRKSGNGEYRFNQSVLFRLRRNMSVEDVRAAVEALVGHHSMLRCRYQPSGDSWYQSIEPDIPSSFHFAHHSIRTDAEVEEVISTAHLSIDIENGPIFAAHHFQTHDGYQMIYMVAHHLAVDLKSWCIIAYDLEGLLTSGCLVSGNTLSFKEWTLHHRHRVQGMKFPFNIPLGNARYWGINATSNTYGNTTAAGFTLSTEITSALKASCKVRRTDLADVFMAALGLSFAQTFRDRSVPVIWNQENDRAALDAERDVSKTVGWFTSLCPFAVESAPTDDIVSVLSRVKDLRRALAGKGVSQFAGNLTDATSALAFASSHCPLELMFTYAGTMQDVQNQDALLEQLPVPGRALASSTSDIGRDVGRIAVFEVSILVDQGETKFKFLYHKGATHQDQIHSWIRSYEKILRQAATKLQNESPGLSLSDIPHMDITEEGLRRLNKEILPRLNLNASNIQAIYPVTAIQQNILTNQCLTPGSSIAQMIFDLDTSSGPVDISRICAAWLQVSGKHSALRTVFSQSVSKNGLYDQIVLRSHSPNMLFLESDSVEDAMVSIDNLPPLLLNEGNPWHRLVVCQVAGKTFLKLEASQAVCDVASMPILFKELGQIYFHDKAPAVFEASYPEYTQCLKATACSIDFWREHLQGVQPCRFPTLISKRPTQSQWETTSIDLKIPSESLKSFASIYKIKISTVLRVAWGLVLRTFVGTDNVCFGSRISGRGLPVEGLRSAVGSFSTVVTSWLAIASDAPLAQLLLAAEEEYKQVLDHQHVPVSRVEHELKVKGDHLFNTCLAFGYKYVADDPSRCRHVRTEQSSEYDINTDVYFHDGNVTLDIGYRILTSDQATTVAYAFGRAIEAILDAPTSLAKETDLFSMRDHRQILAWNNMPQVDVHDQHIHQLIACQASRNPDIQAVCAWDGDLCYGSLHKSSVILAKHLLASGLKPQMPVPVIVNKSRWAVVAMLAVLHAGAIIVPIDAELPSTFSWVIKTVSAKFVLVSDDIRKHVDGLGAKVTVVNENTVTAMSAQPVGLSPPHAAPHDIACILFTSVGSSKTPKGISYSHGALATACAGQGSTLLINPSSRVMQLSSYSVDIALAEIFTTLVNGGCVCVPSAKEKITDFPAAARRMRVNWTYLTPTLSRKLDPETLPDIAVVCFRTRHLDDDACAPWVGKAKVLLAYGSAEACPLALSATEVTPTKASQCFGNPFCGNFWIVSPEDNNRLMPVGALGELVIGGPTLASGFDVNDPDVLTCVGKSVARAKSLLEKSGSRLLKTGHYVRYREDGEIEFVSDDSQEAEIGSRKFRLSDVEPKLRQCLGRGVDVVVETIAFNDPNSAPVLAAFIELGENLMQGNESLSKPSRMTKERLYLSKKMADMILRETLPSYMIPSAYIPVKRMPLTPTMEVNRVELQRMISGLSKKQLLGLAEVSNPQEVQNTSFKPLPLTEAEQRMRVMWAKVLDIEQESITTSDGFLSLGGDAVLAHDLVIECRERGLGISIIDVLRNISLAELCRAIVIMETTPAAVPEVRVAQPSPPNTLVDEAIAPRLGSDKSLIEDVAEASSLQATYVESGMLQSHGNVNYLTINITGSIDWHKLQDACYMLTKAHPILRTAFVSHGRQLYQTVLRSCRPEFQRYQCQGWRLSNLVTKLVKGEQPLPVDFRQPITKFFYFDAKKSSALVIRLSRAQYDDHSMRVLVQDLSQFYSRGDRAVRRASFCDLVRAAQFLHSNDSAEHWRRLLAGASVTQIIEQSSPTHVDSNSTTLRQQIPTGSLQLLGIPFESILKGAWSVVLSNLSDTDDVVFGQFIEGNNLSLLSGQDISDVVGPTGNIIPIRTRVPDAPITPYEYFRSIQSQHVTSVPHENMQTLDIIQKCTTWPAWTRFSSVVYHQNMSEEEKSIDFNIGDARCKLDSIESNSLCSDIFIKSVMSGTANVDISFTFCEKKVPLSFADEVLKMLCSVISLLTSAFVIEPVTLKGLCDNCDTSRIPLPSPKCEINVPSTVESVEPDRAKAVHTMISNAWDTILDVHSLKVPDIRSVPFYEIWGALLPAAELAKYYNENMPWIPGIERVTFTMEEIIEHPTMMQQYELIIAKQQIPQLRGSRSLMLMRTQTGWNKGIRKLSNVSVTSNPSSFMPSSYPALRGHKPSASSGSTSMDSMTNGSSQSDDDELREDAIPLRLLVPGMKAMAKGSDAKVAKMGASLLGRMKKPSFST
ncbi:uncharacterized protein F4822DRAFT_99196 [Hypoxylon trugodes]|uniref:uncharacterized protein n=1 Tax=Hypoxylon trugodes TaxID=326681 RepID=UPI00219AD5FB|nr:uncharacterized protein F4822DRAFT_99196 [Hypoxylon trugodes]KAI1382860.1 hypothetical protein F4822DRAFT_99196 [Hypoxylon trugodes]